VSQRQSPADLSKTQQPSLPAAHSSQPLPLPLGSDLLRRVAGGITNTPSTPKKGW
jgi:hypothetical protein